MSKLYSAQKFLHFPDRLEALRHRTVAAPVHIRIKPTNACNHDCWYCAYRNSNLKLGEDMDERDSIPRDKMMQIVDDIVALGVKAVTFSGGGEPLIYKPLPEVIARLAAGGVRIASLTNGVNLRGRMADAFAAHGTWVRISMDGWDDASYVASRSAHTGDFDKLMTNMAEFAARGSKCVLGVSFIVDARNHAHLAEMCRRLRDIGVNHVKVSGAITHNTPAECNAYFQTFADETRRQIDAARKLAGDGFAILDHFHDITDRFEKSYTSCPSLVFATVIGADCMVYTCKDKAYTKDGILGSIKERSFREFWFSEDNQRALYGLDPSRTCGHHCMAHATNLQILDVLSVDPDHVPFV